MKSKTKVSILFALVIIFLFSSISNSRFSKNIIANNNYLEYNEKDQGQIKLSGFWDLTGSPIFVDDSDTNYNWSKIAAENDWCSGSGSWADPYVIENVTIDGQGSGNCIEIRKSDAYFIIRNCSLYNSGSSFDNAGIKLENVDNGKIINCNCSDNNWDGIYLDDSNNNTLSGITASNNNYFGISLRSSNNNMLSGNIANNNNYNGIYIMEGVNNTLSGNLMNFCGISLYGSLVEMVSHSIDKTNLVNNKPIYYYANEIGLKSSNFTNAGQIILINCTNSIISELNISDGSGIYLYYCVNNTLSGNTANNSEFGILLYSSDNNTLSGNTASNNGDVGIYLWNSDNNKLSGNTASNNGDYGIYLETSHNNALSGSTVNSNYRGIFLDYSNYNTLSGNTANNNNYGIYLWVSDNNMISGNIISNNNFRGIHVRYSNNNTLSGNLLNFCGIILTGSLEEMASHSIDDTNLVNNKPVYYYVNEIGLGSNNFMNSGQIILINCTNSIISGLNISDGSGIFLVYSNYNTFSGNTIKNNSHGIIFDSNSNNNSVFLNNFSNNGIDAEDNGINNRWDNGIIGNYWDDYSGVDANDDGIGDTPYYISGTAGSQDNFPIWTDGDEEIPEVPIISFGNYYILFMFITILSFIILEKQKKK